MITTFEEAEALITQQQAGIPPLPPIVTVENAANDDDFKIWNAGYNSARLCLLGEAGATEPAGFGDVEWHDDMSDLLDGGISLDRFQYEIFRQGRNAWRNKFFADIFFYADKDNS